MATKHLIRNLTASAAVVGAMVAGGAAIASAQSTDQPSTASTSSSSTDQQGTTQTDPADGPESGQDEPDGPGHGGCGAHTEVTGDELTKVTGAVTAHDSSVTVERVMKDDDGSYDVMGTKDGEKIALEVTADLQTITERDAPHGAPGGEPDQETQDDQTDAGSSGN